MWFFKKKEYVSDEELVAQYKKDGDKNTFAELFKKHMKIIYGTCLFYLQNKQEAEDATMQLFEKLLIEVQNRDIQNFKGWLSFVVRNHCITIIRKNKSYQKNIKSYYEFEYEAPHLETEEKINAITDEKMIAHLVFCLPQLKEKQRICIDLFYLKNKSYQDIATQTQYSINEIKSYIQNGKRNLKLLLEEQSKAISQK